MHLLNHSQYSYIEFARHHYIEYGNAPAGLRIKDQTVDVLYSSHMLEHLDRIEADIFLREAFRVLRPGGIIRIAVPDISKHVEQYNESGNADAFIKALHVCVPRPRSLTDKLRLLLIGTRHHQWMYDATSLANLLQKHCFVRIVILPAGKTKIKSHEPLDLHENYTESVYIEAEKPST